MVFRSVCCPHRSFTIFSKVLLGQWLIYFCSVESFRQLNDSCRQPTGPILGSDWSMRHTERILIQKNLTFRSQWFIDWKIEKLKNNYVKWKGRLSKIMLKVFSLWNEYLLYCTSKSIVLLSLDKDKTSW